FKRFAFADVLKDEVSELYKIDRDSLDTADGKAKLYENEDVSIIENKTTVRDILIAHGQKRRKEDLNYWVDKVIQSILEYEKVNKIKLQKIVITDWRFPNEFTVIHNWLNVLTDENNRVLSWQVRRWKTAPLLD